MGTIQVREFVGGLDTRKLPETSQGGTLIRAFDGHIDRGGQFEKRPAFLPAFNLPPGTKGLAATRKGLYVFGSGAIPNEAFPPGVGYYRTPHPDPAPAVQSVQWDVYRGDNIYAAVLYNDGLIRHFYAGENVTDFFDGRARALFQVIDGTDGAVVTGVLVGGVNVLGANPVLWQGNTEDTVAAIVQGINLQISSPIDFEATQSGSVVAIAATDSGTAPNGMAITFTVENGSVTFIPAGLTMAGGANPADAGGAYTPGLFVKTAITKVFATSGPVLFFSGIEQPTRFRADVTGSGFVDMSTNAGGSEQLVGLAKYNQYMAVFSARTIQMWFFEADPLNSKQVQVLERTGTVAARSITQYGDTDVYYLDDSGIRSLKARDSSNAAFTSDIGNPIDTLIQAQMDGLTVEQRARAIGLIEPRDGRFWLILDDLIYVFSYFTSSKVSAWSVYRPGFVIEDAVVFNRRVYVRSGDVIYAFGGTGPTPAYDETEAEAWLPYLDANAPTKAKTLTGFDAVTRGTWEVRIGLNPNRPEMSEPVMTVKGTTYLDEGLPAMGESTHFSLRMKSKGGGPALLAAAVMHFAGGGPEDKGSG